MQRERTVSASRSSFGTSGERCPDPLATLRPPSQLQSVLIMASGENASTHDSTRHTSVHECMCERVGAGQLVLGSVRELDQADAAKGPILFVGSGAIVRH